MKITVLLVEDSKFQRLVNERMLHKAGYTVLNASDGEEALRMARENIPDIIFAGYVAPQVGRARSDARRCGHDAPTARNSSA